MATKEEQREYMRVWIAKRRSDYFYDKRDGIWYESTAAYALSRKGIRGRPPNVAHGGGKQGIRKCKCDLCLERRRIYMRELRASAERERMPDHAYQTRA
jgi:hypothetical protein